MPLKLPPAVRGWLGWVDELLARLVDERSLVLESREGQPQKYGSVCVFAHYDPQGIVDPYVIRYLEELSRSGNDIVFVSTSASPYAPDAERVLRVCRRWILRRNLGLDFGSWKVGLSSIAGELGTYERLVLANDSVYGPLTDLLPLFEKMRARGFDLWGATETMEGGYHLQSYFLVFERAALQSSFFSEFWGGFRFYRGKQRIIRRYEIGLTEAAKAAGLKGGALVSEEEVRTRARSLGSDFQYRDRLDKGEPLNPTLFMWDILLRDFEFPFLKTELLKLNRFGSVAIRQWDETLNDHCHYPVDLIREHIRRIQEGAE